MRKGLLTATAIECRSETVDHQVTIHGSRMLGRLASMRHLGANPPIREDGAIHSFHAESEWTSSVQNAHPGRDETTPLSKAQWNHPCDRCLRGTASRILCHRRSWAAPVRMSS